ncbi:hypothetical protein BJX63DRAFT_442098 [Aspergillus granulosus]|uniref:Zn(2)-C6 fungal-type domain-containing protein n=1 Tax=Aspergillus granulosus TaxID=176169 RepID=A0ABR4GRE5_9EURO
MTRMAGTHPPIDGIIEPQFRLACEECHARKIRCELSVASSGGSCKACALNQRRCVFSLRSRTGRPRKHPPTPSSPPQKLSSMQSRPIKSSRAEPSQHPPLSIPASMRPAQTEQIGSLLQQHIGSAPDGQGHIWVSEENNPAGWNESAWQQPHPTLASSPGPFGALLQPGLGWWGTTDSIHFTIQGSRTGFISEAGISDLTPLDTIIGLEGPDNTGEAPQCAREQGFLDALKLYSGLYNNCESTNLDLLTEAGQCRVRSIAKLFDELSQAAFALQADNDTLPSSSSPLCSDVPEAEIIRVALREAIQVSIGIIQYNFQLHHSTTTGPVDGSEQLCSSRQAYRSKTCNCLVTAKEKQLGIQFGGLELLIRLEFSLIRFRHVVSKAECLHTGQPSPQRLRCNCWVNFAPVVDTARSQVSELLKQFRTLWD